MTEDYFEQKVVPKCTIAVPWYFQTLFQVIHNFGTF